MDSVWVAYIRDRPGDLYKVAPKKYPYYKDSKELKMVIGIYDSQEKAERALNIVLQRKGWRGSSYHPNCWIFPDRYEYGWREIPFNQFNVEELYGISDFFDRR